MNWQIITICVGIVAWALISQRLSKTLLTLPMLFVGFGYLLGEAGAGLLDIRVDSKLLHIFAEFTLVLVLFSDGASAQPIANWLGRRSNSR